MPSHPPASTIVPVLLAACLALLCATPASAASPGYRLPVDDEVVQDFEAPATEYASGHRGVDLRAAPGTPVAAAAGGTVAHAGDVAGATWVTIEHLDGVTTSYGPLTDLQATVGEQVSDGDLLGVVAAGGHGQGDRDHGLHWSARHAGSYVDPLSLLGALKLPSLVGVGGWGGSDLAVTPFDPWRGARWNGWGLHGSPRADRPGFAVPPNANHLITVGGLNSATGSPLLDPDHLGYGPDSATRFSYAGVDAQGRPLPYGPADTWGGIDAAARRLAGQLRAQQRQQPFRAVDLVGHSHGGVVILHYLANHHDPLDPSLPPIGNVATIASPLQGADLANIGRTVRDDLVTGAVAAVGAYLADPHRQRFKGAAGLPLDELAVGSPLLRQLSRTWEAAVEAGTAGPLATGTRVLTLAGAGDGMVATHRTQAPGDTADHGAVLDTRVLPGDHTGVLETEAVREVTYRFLQGREPVESPGRLASGASWAAGTFWRLVGEGYAVHGLHRAARTGSSVEGIGTVPTGAEVEVPQVNPGQPLSDPWQIGTSGAPAWWPDPWPGAGRD